MNYYADLHIHSKYSRATSKNCDLEHLSLWAQKKGITVLGTGDFTHPRWFAELKEKLIPAEPGFFRLPSHVEKTVQDKLPFACQGQVRFMLSVEISTIYKKGDKTRKVHHLLYAPHFAAAEKIIRKLEKIGNIRSDGRPILGLDSRHLLEIALESDTGSYLIPAHIWTPWFAALGSKSGFDSIDECYGDLAKHIFAVETGLSSDPAMNWQVSSLDRFRLVSNSDAHSPEKLGREVCLFNTDLDYYALRAGLETGTGYVGTVEFFPEEGKYHLDGHRKCEVRLTPAETKKNQGQCPVCKGSLTVGVMHRVHDLADKQAFDLPRTAGEVHSLVPLPEILGEIHGVGVQSKTVAQSYERLLNKLGAELAILQNIPLEELQQVTSSLMVEAVQRLRQGKVIREAGYDGEYGVIHLFEKNELRQQRSGNLLFATEIECKAKKELIADAPAGEPMTHEVKTAAAQSPAEEDREQKQASEIFFGPLMIFAGPGSGKTRTLTQRIANLIQQNIVAPEHCLAITFTRRACEEMRERLQRLLPELWRQIPIYTFHALCLSILQEQRQAAGLQRGFRVASAKEQVQLLQEVEKFSDRQAKKLLHKISRTKCSKENLQDPEFVRLLEIYHKKLEEHNLLDFDDVILRAVKLFQSHEDLRDLYRKKYSWISIDEFQDIDTQQYELVKILASANANLCVIGDPDQAIYSFRGGSPQFFAQLQQDYPDVKKIRLRKNYRSHSSIVHASSQLLQHAEQERLIPASLQDPQLITMHEAASERAEAEFVVKTMEGILGGHSFFSTDSGRGSGASEHELSFADFAILYRTEAQVAPLLEALQRSGMPYQYHKAGVVGGSAEELLSAQALQNQLDSWDPRADRIALLTLHAAKGLEFAVVFIVGCEQGLIPLQWNAQDAANLAEERRLFYVGMTRAKQKLILSHAKRRFWQGKIRERERSSFLQEIQEQLIQHSKFSTKPKKPQNKEGQLDLFGDLSA